MSYSTINNTEGAISPLGVNEFTERYERNNTRNNYIENLYYNFNDRTWWYDVNNLEIKISFDMSDEVEEFMFGEMEGLESKKKICNICCENAGDIKSDCCNCNSYCLKCVTHIMKNDKRKHKQPCCVYCRQQFKKITSNDGNHVYNLNEWASYGYPLDFMVKQK
jgi:hypothetical protein